MRHLGVVLGLVATVFASQLGAQPPEKQSDKATAPATILRDAVCPIDLVTALRLAGAENPELQIARQRVVEGTAFRQFAAAQILPNLNLGTNYNLHRGVLQQDNGNILRVDRDALYVGLGANAIGAGTVNIPGLNYNLNVGSAWYGYLAARQQLTTARLNATGVTNDVQLRVALAYLDLVRAEGRRAIAVQNREEGAELVRLTDAFATAGQGRKADADRAAVELRRRDADLTQAEADALTASARLCQLLALDPSTRLRPLEGWAVPEALVPEPITLPELLATALMRRPELAARRSDVQQALYQLSLAKVLPFSPNVILGFSTGGFGGGSDLVSSPQGFVGGDGERTVAPRFGDLKGRADFDLVVFWTFRNMGVGNAALIRAAESQMKQSLFRELETLNLVRAQVAESHARTAARVLQIDAAEKAVRSSTDAYKEDFTRIKGGQGLPLEVIDSLRLLGRSRYEYLEAIIDYNRAQFQLWTALGNPPADALVRPVPANLLPAEGAPRTARATAAPVPRSSRQTLNLREVNRMIRVRARWLTACATIALGGCVSNGPDRPLVGTAFPAPTTGYPTDRGASGRAPEFRAEPVVSASDPAPPSPAIIPTGRSAPAPEPATFHTIDLEIALRLGGVENPTINLARERVNEALAGQLAARALLLPSVRVGGNFRLHRGALIAAPGVVRDVASQSLYLGGGAGAAGGGTVTIPGVQLFANLGEVAYEPLAARQRVSVRSAESHAVQNAILLDVALAYLRLVESETRCAVLRGATTEAAEVVRLTTAHADAGQGRRADANRAAANAELLRRELRRVEEDVAVASAGLCRLLALDPSEQLRTASVSPPQAIALVPEDADPEPLIQGAIQARPELQAGAAAIAEAQTRLRQQRARPFLPTVSVGYSAGGFGGGSDLQPSDFGPLMGRSNFDVLAVWNVQNFGFGNGAQTRRADAVLGATIAGYDVAVNRVRREVTEALADARAAARQIKFAGTAVATAEEGYRLERERIRQAQGRPIEALDSLRQLVEARQELVRAVIAFNAAQFRLFVALGNSPAASR